jgi:hypothetical protein
MKRHWVLALATLVALPCMAQAQGDPGWGPYVRVTPWLGVSPGFTQQGEALVVDDDGFGSHPYELKYGSSVSAGLNVEVRVWNQFAVIGGAAWSSRGQGDLVNFEDELIYDYEGSTLWIVKAGLAMRLREVRPDLQLRRLNASIFVAPAFIADIPKTTFLTPSGSGGNVHHFGINLGAEAELPLSNDRLAFQVGFEDYIIFWDDEDFSDRVGGYIRTSHPGAGIAIDTDNSHMVMLRFGLSYRL